MEFYCVTIQMKAIKKYFLVLPSVILNNPKKKLWFECLEKVSPQFVRFFVRFNIWFCFSLGGRNNPLNLLGDPPLDY